MKTTFKTGLTLGVLVFVGCVYGCSSDDGNDSGTGGTDSGGAAPKAGAGGRGGAAGSGGKAQSGGTAGASSVTLGGAAGKANVQGGASGAGVGGTGSGGKATGGNTATGGAGTGGSGTGGKATAGSPGTAGTAGTAGAKPTGGVAGSAAAGTAGKTGSTGGSAGSVGTAGTAGRGVAGAGTGAVAGATAFGGTAGTTSIHPGTAGTAGVGTTSVQSTIVKYLGQACYECALTNCTDPDIAGADLFASSCDNITGNATAGTAIGTSKQSLCFDTLSCVLGNKCSSNSSVQPCFCGTAVGTTCLSAPTGVCKDTELAGLETTDNTTAGLTFTNLNFGAGRANAMVLCMLQNCTDFKAIATNPTACNGIVP